MSSSWEKYKAFAEKASAAGDYEQAESMWLAALEEAERFGQTDPRLAITIEHLADIAVKKGNAEVGEELYRKALIIKQSTLGSHHLDVAAGANNLAELYCSHGKFEEAEPLYIRVLEIYERAFGPDHPGSALIATNLAIMYHAQEKYDQAEPLYQRAIAIQTKLSGYNHPDTLKVMDNYADLLITCNRQAEALQLKEMTQLSADGVYRNTLHKLPQASTLSRSNLTRINDPKKDQKS